MTTSANSMHSDEKMREELTFLWQGVQRRFQQTQEKFLADAQTNPAHAILWGAEEMTKVQTQYELWLVMTRHMEQEGPASALRWAVGELQHRVRSFFGSNSTSMFDNAVSRARAESCLHLAEELENLARHFGL